MKPIRILLWGLVVFALVGIVVAEVVKHRNFDAPPTHSDSQQAALFDVPPITLTDQEGKSFSTGELRGRPWIADFIFTSCAGSCPIMSHQMAQLQQKLPASVAFVSFTVDPKTDTSAILKEYGQGLKADFSRWHFLTGTPEQMSDAAVAMKIAVHPADKDFALSHSDRFLLVNGSGQVVGVYQGTSSEDIARLAQDAAKLANSAQKAS